MFSFGKKKSVSQDTPAKSVPTSKVCREVHWLGRSLSKGLASDEARGLLTRTQWKKTDAGWLAAMSSRFGTVHILLKTKASAECTGIEISVPAVSNFSLPRKLQQESQGEFSDILFSDGDPLASQPKRKVDPSTLASLIGTIHEEVRKIRRVSREFDPDLIVAIHEPREGRSLKTASFSFANLPENHHSLNFLHDVLHRVGFTPESRPGKRPLHRASQVVAEMDAGDACIVSLKNLVVADRFDVN